MKEFTCYRKTSNCVSLSFDLTQEMVDYINDELKLFTYLDDGAQVHLTYDEVYEVLKDVDSELGGRGIGIQGRMQLTILCNRIENLIGNYLARKTIPDEWAPERGFNWSKVLYNEEEEIEDEIN